MLNKNQFGKKKCDHNNTKILSQQFNRDDTKTSHNSLLDRSNHGNLQSSSGKVSNETIVAGKYEYLYQLNLVPNCLNLRVVYPHVRLP